ncbi:MAG: DUF1499 domain-containing protein [Peptostreptococcaceae bacterium]|nr:DUF1499 domain-containing protein [Peptostreptococcaceae bacterium]
MNNYGDMKITEEEGNYIHIVFTTKSMRFNDDVELLFDLTLKQIYYRSASRIGYRDNGLNKQRYQDIKKAYLDNL